MADTQRPTGYESQAKHDLAIAIQKARAGLTTDSQALFLVGIGKIREIAGSDEGLSSSDIRQIIKVLKFVFGSAYYDADGVAYGQVEGLPIPHPLAINEKMACMISDLIAT